MTQTGRFLLLFRASLSAISSPNPSLSHSRNSLCGKYEQLKTLVKGLEPVLLDRASSFQNKLNFQRQCIQNLCFSGRKFIIGSACVLGSVDLRPQISYAMDEHIADLSSPPGLLEEDPYTFWAFARKFWLPAFLVMTVLTGWGHPFTLTVKVILFLLSTNPSPFSVYLFVEQLRHQSMRQEPHLFHLKSLYARKVEVEDYRLLCFARVELRDQKITLIGILGGWWVLQASPYQERCSVFWSRILNG